MLFISQGSYSKMMVPVRGNQIRLNANMVRFMGGEYRVERPSRAGMSSLRIYPACQGKMTMLPEPLP